MQRGCSDGDPKNFAMIAKILLGLRKFSNHSENFAILAKLRIFARLAKFRYLAKFTVPSENFQFRYLTIISLKFTVDSEISQFRYLCRISLG